MIGAWLAAVRSLRRPAEVAGAAACRWVGEAGRWAEAACLSEVVAGPQAAEG